MTSQNLFVFKEKFPFQKKFNEQFLISKRLKSKYVCAWQTLVLHESFFFSIFS